MTRRLDAELVARGLARSRGQARELLEAGSVLLAGVVATKPATPTEPTDHIVLSGDPDPWVGRAAHKLLHALRLWGPGTRVGAPVLDPSGLRCLDVGASTGGFTQVLLAHGAETVTALDVGHGQLVSELLHDPRVVDRSGTNIRDVGPGELGGRFDLLVSDLSFISLTLVLGRLRELTTPTGDLVVLVKPQFEVGREHLARGGVVRAAGQHREVLRNVHRSASAVGLTVLAGAPSPILGSGGNREFLLWLTPRVDACGLGVDDMLDGMDLGTQS